MVFVVLIENKWLLGYWLCVKGCCCAGYNVNGCCGVDCDVNDCCGDSCEVNWFVVCVTFF